VLWGEPCQVGTSMVAHGSLISQGKPRKDGEFQSFRRCRPPPRGRLALTTFDSVDLAGPPAPGRRPRPASAGSNGPGRERHGARGRRRPPTAAAEVATNPSVTVGSTYAGWAGSVGPEAQRIDGASRGRQFVDDGPASSHREHSTLSDAASQTSPAAVPVDVARLAGWELKRHALVSGQFTRSSVALVAGVDGRTTRPAA